MARDAAPSGARLQSDGRALAYLDVITKISDGAGTLMGPAEELRFQGATLTRRTGDGPDRVEVVFGVSSSVFDTVAEVEAIDVSGMPIGTEVHTAAPRAMTLKLGSNDPATHSGLPNNRTIFAANGDGKAWYRDVPSGAPGANFVNNWYVDTSVGNDENDGTIDTEPLQTVQEALMRIGRQPIDGSIVGTVYINVLGDDGNDITVDVRFIKDGFLYFLGTRSVLATYTMTTVTAWSDSTGVVGRYSLSGAPDLSAHVGKMIRISSGAQAGDKGAVAKDFGSGEFRCNFADQSTGLGIEPTGTPTVQLYDIPSLSGNVRISSGPGGSTGGTVVFEAMNVGVPGADHSVVVADGQVEFFGCIVHGLDVYRAANYASAYACMIHECRSYSQFQGGGCTFMSAGGTALSSRQAGLVIIIGRCLSQGYVVSVGHQEEGPGHLVAMDSFAVVDSTTNGLNVFPGSSVVMSTYITIRDCTGSSAGVKVYGGANVQYTTGAPPKFAGTGATNEYVIGGTNKTAINIAGGDYTASNGACVAVYQ